MATGFQRVIVMRHGARLDTANPSWERNEGKTRPYDTPLTEPGRVEAFDVANRRYKDKGISVVISSPFLRCLQTAQESCRALNLSGIIIDNSVSEVLSPGSKMKAPPEVPLQDLSPYSISIVQHDSNPLPPFPETSQQAIARYLSSIPSIADQYYPNNLLIVTHQYGVEQAVTLALGDSRSYEASYCGHVMLTRTSTSDGWAMEGMYRVDPYWNLID